MGRGPEPGGRLFFEGPEVSHQADGSLEDHDVAAGQGPLAGLEHQVEMGPPHAPQVKGPERRTDSKAKRLQLGEVTGAREHVRPPWGVQIVAIHEYHGTAPRLRPGQSCEAGAGPVKRRAEAPGRRYLARAGWPGFRRE